MKHEYVVTEAATGHAVTKFYRQRAAAQRRCDKLNAEIPTVAHTVREFAGHIVTKGK